MRDVVPRAPRAAMSRREVLCAAGGCAAHLALAGLVMPLWARRAWAGPRGPVVAREPFGVLEQVAEGVWALVSDPFGGDRTTLSNGGLVAGRTGVLAIEGFNTSAGAAWLGAQAKRLTGRWPTHVVVTHYHADHANGVAGYRAASEATAPSLLMTDTTRDLAIVRNRPPTATPESSARETAWRDAAVVPATGERLLDLGDLPVRVLPMAGHTASDVAVHLPDRRVVFGGDLLWNGILPNYVDADPPALRRAADALATLDAARFVPGHGAVADVAAVRRYRDVLDELERAARAAHAAGTDATTAANAYALPPSLGEWRLFGRVFYVRAFTAWYRVLGG
ncbi:MAG: MBL fold metallo-hydrolase [Gemmatimonadaceae bacterium]|jgi:glyoxylase-like metal-dependent hydrolase (beta-lactamase superfamily II)|nr:MBL fold metallo-hydrolase [Gemmatimonadaceae bacterium]